MLCGKHLRSAHGAILGWEILGAESCLQIAFLIRVEGDDHAELGQLLLG
jgi:hypothetical protein